MATSFYPLAEAAPVAVSAGTKAGSLPKALNNNEAGSAVDKWLANMAPSEGNNVLLTINSQASTTQQSHYFGRFCSNPLLAQTIPAQSWNYALFIGETNTSANTFLWPVIYVWRPSNSSVVGYIYNASANAGSELPAVAATATRTTAGGAAVTCQDGDILVVEIWAAATQGAATSYAQTLRLNGNTSFISSPYTVLFQPVPWSIFAMKTLAAIGQTADAVEVVYIAGSWGAAGASVSGPAKWDNFNTRGVVGSGVGGNTPVGNFSDSFNAITNWTPNDPAGYTSSVTGGELVQTLPATTPYAYANIASTGLYSLIESSASTQLVQIPQGAFNNYGVECYFQISKRGVTNNWIGFQWASAPTNSLLYAIHNTNGTTTNVAGTTTPYNSTNHKWLRIRHTNGIVYWEVGPDIVATGPVAAFADVEDPDTITSDGTLGPLPRAGSIGDQEDADSISSAAGVGTGAVVSRTEANDGIVSAGTVVSPPARAGVVDSVEANDSISSAGTVVNPVARTGVVDKTEDADTISALAGATATGTLDVTESPDTLAATGVVTTPSILYFSDTAPSVSPTAGDKATTWPLTGSLLRTGWTTEASLTSIAPAGNTPHNILIPLEYIGNVSAFFGRFSSNRLTAQTIPAQNWTYAPTVSTSTNLNLKHTPVMYVWRPSDSTVVGYIFDSSAAAGIVWPTTGAAQQRQDFAGAAVTCQDGDILVIEAWGFGFASNGNGGGGGWTSESPSSSFSSPYAIQFLSNRANLAVTEESDAIAATGTVTTTATLSQAEANDSIASAGTVVNPAARTATLSQIEADDSIASAGTVVNPAARTASLAQTEANDSIVSGSSIGTGASVVKTEADDTITSGASNSIGASVVKTEANDAVSSGAAVSTGASVVKTEADDSIASGATVTAPGTRLAVVDTQEANDSISSGASNSTGASVVKVEDPDAIACAGTVVSPAARVATLDVREDNDGIVSAGSGVVLSAITASVDLRESDDIAGAAGIVAGVGRVSTLDVTEASDGVQASSTASIGASVAVREADDVPTASTTVPLAPRTATVSQVEGGDVFVGYLVRPRKRVCVTT